MNLKLKNGQMYIDGKQVAIITFMDYTSIKAGDFNHDSIDVENNGVRANVNSAAGDVRVTQNKNIVSGAIVCSGSVHIGDK